LNKISSFHKNLDFWQKFGFLTKIWIFDQNLDFWPKFGCLTKISISDQNIDIWPKFPLLIKIWMIDQNFDTCQKFPFYDNLFNIKLNLLAKILIRRHFLLLLMSRAFFSKKNCFWKNIFLTTVEFFRKIFCRKISTFDEAFNFCQTNSICCVVFRTCKIWPVK